jgi:hypothetical protein
VALISVLGSVIAVVATYFWLMNYREAIAEPASQFAIAIIWLMVALVQFLIPSDPEWEIIHAKRAKHDQETMQRVLHRLQQERYDFEQILTRKGQYNSAAHRKAAEVESFDLLQSEIAALRLIPSYRRRAEAILKEIKRNQSLSQKDVSPLIALLNRSNLSFNGTSKSSEEFIMDSPKCGLAGLRARASYSQSSKPVLR